MEPWGKRIKIGIGSGLIGKYGLIGGQKDEWKRKEKGKEGSWKKGKWKWTEVGNLEWKDVKWRMEKLFLSSALFHSPKTCFSFISDHRGSVCAPDREQQDNAKPDTWTGFGDNQGPKVALQPSEELGSSRKACGDRHVSEWSCRITFIDVREEWVWSPS